ncbi:MAG TPA: murein biosynthesis integral membrane protein MurJ [Bryobacteraceae bacterium]|jgi:putative peptidoglycan lipid II flippase|nr:murein biosynthesis integral membrane protein MurJ [Bryobacteraceae bacterium]
MTPRAQTKLPRKAGGASLVAAGIFLSRIAGLLRESIFAAYFGTSPAAAAFRQALRIPNFLQTLFGEGVLSASFIPVYAGLVARGNKEEAGRVAGAVFAILALLTSALVLLGVLATPLFIDLIAPGFTGSTRDLTITLVRILFPGTGLLVLSAWCLGILNSHRRFFLSYSVPVLWNIAMIAALVWFGPRVEQDRLARVVAWASVIGSAAQVLAQLPVVLRLVPELRVALETHVESVRIVIRNFGPVFISRGVIQLSAFIDSIFASYLPIAAVPALGYAQTLYLLPISLFGMSVSASELPEMSSAVGDREQVSAHLRARLLTGLRRIAFFVIPSAVAFIALGDIVAAAIYQHRKFTHDDAIYTWGILAGSGVGLLASTQGRLYSSAFYALKDTRTPLRFAVVRVALTTILGYCAAFPLPTFLGLDPKWGAAGLTASAGISGWIEFLLLRRSLGSRIGSDPVGAVFLARLWASAIAAAAVTWAIKLALEPHLTEPKLLALATLIPYGLIYLTLTGPAQLKDRLRGRHA